MSAASHELEEFLDGDESFINGAPGTLVDGTHRSEGSIGVTDRRILFVADGDRPGGDRFIAIAHDAICSIESRPKTTFTTRGAGYRLLLVLGTLIATSTFFGVVVFAPHALSLVLMTLAVGGIVGAEYVRRSGVDIGRDVLNEASETVRAELEDRGVLPRYEGDTKHGDDSVLVVVGAVSVASVALIALIALTESLIVVPLVLVTVGGIALADYAHRRTAELDGTGRSRRREREVCIDLASGRRVHLRVDATARIDHELGELARKPMGENREIELSHAPSRGASAQR